MGTRVWGIVLLATVLASCNPVYKTAYELTPPTEPVGRQCVTQCQYSKLLCQQSGKDRRAACLAEERADAERRYADYKVERIREGKKVEKSLSDFDRSYRCGYESRYTSSCEPDFVSCFATCGGNVKPYTYCAAFCN